MADITTDQNFPTAVLTITNKKTGGPATVDGIPVWASSDETVLTAVATADGMGAVIDTVAPGTARVTVTGDADLGAGVAPITGVSEDIIVTAGAVIPVLSIALGTPATK